PPPALHDRRRRRGVDRPSLPAPGRGGDAPVRHGRLRLARRPGGHHPRPRHDGTGTRPDRAAGGRRADAPRSRMSSDDYYDLVGVEADAPVADIRAAYRERKAEVSDRDDDDAKADAAALNKAWNVLSDPYQRGRYDEQLAAGDDDDDDDGDDD